MKGMSFKAFPFKFTCLIGFAFLGAIFWTMASNKATSIVYALILGLFFLVSGLISLGLGLSDRSDIGFYRVMINVLILTLVIPFMRFGFFVRNQIFLNELPRYQQITDMLVAKEKAKTPVFRTSAYLPPDCANFSDDGSVLLQCDANNIVTAMYSSGSSGVLHHEGYLYRSNDDTGELKKQHRELGFIRLAPKWYFWAD